MRDLHLYINEQEVDLGDESLILYNWSETELSNPANTQNSFSKVITLKGTKRNNRVFSHLWNIERIQAYNGELNPSRRIPFRVTYDGDNVFEEGYCKLQNVKLSNGVYSYEISLFGMIGNFLNNLATNYSDGSVKTLADLHYYFYGDGGFKSEYDLDFNINVSAVTEAWHNLGGYESKWEVLNFANCYNGVPQNMDADKVLIDGAEDYRPFISTATTKDGTRYETANDKMIVKTQDKMSKDEVKDYRSYLMTPVISAKSIIKAVCDKDNNAGKYDNGYEVELDPDFFNWHNPYYENCWMTLPQITSLKMSNTTSNTGETVITTMNFVKKEQTSNSFRFIYNISLPSELQYMSDFDITVSFGHHFTLPWESIRDLYMRNRLYELATQLQATSIQAYSITDEATSEYENITAGSNLYWLTSDRYAKLKKGNTQIISYSDAVDYKGYTPSYTPTYVTSNYLSKWYRSGDNNYHSLVMVDDDGNMSEEYNLKLSAPRGTRNIRVCVEMFKALKGFPDSVYYPMPGTEKDNDVRTVRIPEIEYGTLYCKYNPVDSFYSNRLITKQNLLTTSYSVKDWLLSYCKMFGLYIWYDLATSKIHIDTRKAFYQRNKIKNIGGRIDLTKDYSIKPVLAENRYYNMTQEQADTDLAEDYKTEYGKVYGMKTIDTGVDLDTSQKELMDLKLKSTIMTNRKSLYNYLPKVVDGVSGITPYLCNGITYNLYKDGNFSDGSETVEMTKAQYVISDVFEGSELISGSTYSDLIPKPLFSKDDKVVDSANVLLFQDGYDFDLSDKGYYLSDDIPLMSEMNGKPTWILTKDFTDKDYVKTVDQMPMFSRYWTNGSGHILFSLDFGSPRKLYIDNTINHEEATLYDRYYGTYYGDLFDVNTKVLNCYYRPTNVMSINDLREFYWFDNAIWRLNKVTDYNPEKPDFVKVEFVKVQDIEDITCGEATTVPSVILVLDAYSIPATGGTITGYVKCSDYGPWTVGEADGLYVYPMSASTNAEITIDVPPNAQQEDETYFISIEAGDVSTYARITQPAGYGEITSTSFYVHNDTSQIIRIGAMLNYESGTAYRTIAPGQTVTMVVPIPFDGWYWHYDLELTDVFGNADAFGYVFTNTGMDTIVGDDMDDFNYNATNVGANDLSAGTLTISE